ncbi:uncharacterized protein LOC126672330 [Mercurialis annua]|uniref:uncharacterized protein LOC126672330 n=1 Tax=Mercurialis annua TaxID=3986 RepID=UPI00216083AF|nr:uncharacterized protein LOC126672330 [Mercurialis annua]
MEETIPYNMKLPTLPTVKRIGRDPVSSIPNHYHRNRPEMVQQAQTWVDQELRLTIDEISKQMGIAQKYFELDEGCRAIRRKEAKGKESKEKSNEKSKLRSEYRRGRPEESRRFAPQERYEPRYDHRDDDRNYTPLNTSRTNVLMWIKENVKNVVWLPKMKAEIKDTRKYCKFHEDYGHETDGCRDLKVEIKRMIDAELDRDDKGKEKEEERPSKILGTIHMINVGWHKSSTIRRKQRREAMRETHMPPAIFDVEDYEHVKAPHNDALVVTTIIENWNMERILIDEGSDVNLMTNAAYKMLGGTAARLRRVLIPLSGLGGPPINTLGVVTLEVIIGPRRGINKKVMSLFNVVDIE